MRILFIIFFIPLFSFAQKIDNNLLSDSSFALGTIYEDNTYVSRSIESDCFSLNGNLLLKGDVVIISGINYCNKKYKYGSITKPKVLKSLAGCAGTSENEDTPEDSKIDSINPENTEFYRDENTKKYFEIIFRNKTYYVEKDKVKCEESYFNQIANMTPQQSIKFRNYAKVIAEIENHNELLKTKKLLDNCKSKGLAILDWSFYDESEYTEGTGVKIEVYNPTTKVIKYLWFSFIGYNAVDDIVTDHLKGIKTITTKGVGPIKPNESGEYEYKYVWFTDLVQTAIISQIKVQYMDGTIKTILKPKDVVIKKSDYELLFEY